MLLSYSVSNFLSIKDKVTLSFETKNVEEKPENLIETVGENNEKISLLKGLFLYGANASGKSNVLKSFSLLMRLLFNGPEYTLPNGQQTLIKNIHHRFQEDCKDKPTEFEVRFLMDGKRYKFELAYMDGNFIWEKLSVYKNARAVNIYNVKDGKLILGQMVSEKEKGLLRKIFPWAQGKTFLAAIFRERQKDLEFYLKVWLTITSNAVFIRVPENFYPDTDTVNYIMHGEKEKKAVLSLLQDADHAIKDIVIKQVDENHVEVYFAYEVNGKRVLIDLSNESTGTRRLFNMATVFLTAASNWKKDAVLVVDEIDDSLHPAMVEDIVRYLLRNMQGVQLIATTHHTGIMSQLRRDQVVLVEKDKGTLATTVSTMADFTGVRKDLKKEKAYLNGFFGALPYMTLSDVFEEDEE